MNCRVCKKPTPMNNLTKRYNKITSTCKDCSNQRVIKEGCIHIARKHDCAICVDEIHRRVLMMLKTKSNDSDKQRKNDLTYENVKQLITDSGDLCVYCGVDLQHHSNYKPHYSSIERMNESIGHTIDNCVIACMDCNLARVGKHIWLQN